MGSRFERKTQHLLFNLFHNIITHCEKKKLIRNLNDISRYYSGLVWPVNLLSEPPAHFPHFNPLQFINLASHRQTDDSNKNPIEYIGSVCMAFVGQRYYSLEMMHAVKYALQYRAICAAFNKKKAFWVNIQLLIYLLFCLKCNELI